MREFSGISKCDIIKDIPEIEEKDYEVTTAYFTVDPEHFNSPNLIEMQKKLGEVGVFAARNPVEGWPDLELHIDHATFHGEEIIGLKVQELVSRRSGTAR